MILNDSSKEELREFVLGSFFMFSAVSGRNFMTALYFTQLLQKFT